jgi:hypothetical protein
MVLEGKEQHNATHARLVEQNPYAATISLESVALAQKKAANGNKINSLNRSGISKSHK